MSHGEDIFDRNACLRKRSAQLSQVRYGPPDLLPLEVLFRHQTRNRPAMARDPDDLAALNIAEQSREFGLCFGGLNDFHCSKPQILTGHFDRFECLTDGVVCQGAKAAHRRVSAAVVEYSTLAENSEKGCVAKAVTAQ
jgi:hypothetical protein